MRTYDAVFEKFYGSKIVDNSPLTSIQVKKKAKPPVPQRFCPLFSKKRRSKINPHPPKKPPAAPPPLADSPTSWFLPKVKDLTTSRIGSKDPHERPASGNTQNQRGTNLGQKRFRIKTNRLLSLHQNTKHANEKRISSVG